MKKSILIDFSKVVSPIGISRFIANSLSDYLTISPNEIRDIYKKNIGDMVMGKYPMDNFITEILDFAKEGVSFEILKEEVLKLPTLDPEFLDLLSSLKKEFNLYLVSDIFPELGGVLKEHLADYFDEFVFSFEMDSKKSQEIFWEKLANRIDLSQSILFIDDKKENLLLAEKYGVDGVEYRSFEESKRDILEHLYPTYENIILGAGAAGIMYGYFLDKTQSYDFLILEKEKESLGLMKSYKIGESFYDVGGHALHENDKIKKFLKEEGKQNHYEQERKAYIDYEEEYVPFPFQLHLAYLDKQVRDACFNGFMKNHFCNKKRTINNLDEHLKNTFGDGIYKYFLKNYNEKIWKTDLSKISTSRKERIPYEDLHSFLDGYLYKKEKRVGTNKIVAYPDVGGFQSYLIPFFEKISDKIKNEVKIFSIDTKYKVITTNQGIFLYKNLISTIPINVLIKKTNLALDIKNFEYLSLQIIAILVKSLSTEMQRIYSSEKKRFWHKCVLNSNSSGYLKKKDEFLFQFEASYKKNKRNKEKLINNCTEYLIEKGFINSLNDIKEIQYKEHKYGYPIQTIKMQKDKEKIRKKLIELDIYPLGRFGNRDYINFDNLILSTIALFNDKEEKDIII